jgi:uncharacterized membrane protein YoaK (UPF0700 family)
VLYGNESISRYTRSNVSIWMSMAFQAGVLNIGGFMACHRFVSHVTGFATFFGSELNQPGHTHPLRMLQVPLFFLLGSMISGYLVDLRLKLHKRPKYYIAFGIIFALASLIFMGGLTGYFGSFGEPLEQTRDYTLLILLCLICGIQNGTITAVSGSVVRTTHLTGITTDLGLGIVRFFNREKLMGSIPDEGKANLMRIGIITSFGLGSAIGGFLFVRFGFGGFLVPVFTSGFLFGAMLYIKLRRIMPASAPAAVTVAPKIL